MSIKTTIEHKLQKAFQPVLLTVADESHLHKGHKAYQEGKETHFRVIIVAEAFSGQSLLARHRAVHACLAEELRGPVHALALKADAP